MWEPVGPLPAEVYWRRRWVAVASTLSAVLVIVWSIAALIAPVEPDLQPTLDPAAQTAPAPAGPTSDPAVVVIPPPAAAPPPATTPPGRYGIAQPAPPPGPVDPAGANPAGTNSAGTNPADAQPAGAGPAGGPAGPTAPARPVDPPGPPGPAVPAADGGPAGPAVAPPVDPATTEQLRPDDTVRRTGPAPTPVPVPATGPGPCTNAMLGVTTEVAPPTHRVSDRPVLRLVVTNTSAQPCVRDLDPARQEIVVWGADGSRLWSSNDCSTAAGVDLYTLVPGQPVVFAVTWAGRTSTPGCSARRSTVPAGSYNVMTRVDDVISPAVAMTRTA